MRVVTYNIRYDSGAVGGPGDVPHVERPWRTRRIRVAEQILAQNPMIASLQEALIGQVKDLAELLGGQWSWTGVGRGDGRQAEEFGPIFYKKSDLLMITSDTFWLSATPFKPSEYPDAGCRRICTVARFKTIATNEILTVLNTHLDHQSEGARKLGASLVLARARFEARETGGPVFVTGDFNSRPAGIDGGAYKILTGTEAPVPIPQEFLEKYPVNQGDNFHMLDLRTEAPLENSSKPIATYTDFAEPDLNAPIDVYTWHIDFILGGNNGGWSAERYSIFTTPPNDGILASDHYPVSADISISS